MVVRCAGREPALNSRVPCNSVSSEVGKENFRRGGRVKNFLKVVSRVCERWFSNRGTCHQSWRSELTLEPTWRKRTDSRPCPLTSTCTLVTVGLHTKTSFLPCHMPTSDSQRRPKQGKQWKPSVFLSFPWRPLGKQESQCTARKTTVSTVQIHDPKRLEDPHITFIFRMVALVVLLQYKLC